jgi:hypothetical protein
MRVTNVEIYPSDNDHSSIRAEAWVELSDDEGNFITIYGFEIRRDQQPELWVTPPMCIDEGMSDKLYLEISEAVLAVT